MNNLKMEYVKKFKNGKILLSANKNEVDENFYHDTMFYSDLYLNQINGYQYIVDFNTNLVYEIGSYLITSYQQYKQHKLIMGFYTQQLKGGNKNEEEK